jgi:glutaminyl-tRNA synthetase
MSAESIDFIREIINEHNTNGRFDGRVHTRFPPEPNGYLHIGHAKSILLNYGIAQDYSGKFNLRFDDTNPAKEDQEYVDAIIKDVSWLGADWEDRLFFASDYFEQLYAWALDLITKGDAYVDDLSPDQIRQYRGSLTEPGKNSPYRDRSVEESMDLFQRMKAGEFPDGTRVLRAKIDMSHGNLFMRDPVIYRILHASHHRTGDTWCIYPMYDFAHGQSDSVEGITHSIASLEFENHRPLYDWLLDQLGIYHPQQLEFARLNLSFTVLSKRRLIQLVDQDLVNGWDDPRLPTLSAFRRRGVTPESIRAFCDTIGVAKRDSVVDVALLEHHIRQDLNERSPRRMGVLDPLKVVITNYPEGETEWLEAANHPQDESAGTRLIPFSKELYVERDDFMEDPPRKFFRLGPGREVRLRFGYFITCDEIVKDGQGRVTELRCTYDPETKGGYAPDGRKVRGTIHWVSVAHAVPAEVRLYDRLFLAEDPMHFEEGGSFVEHINPDSLVIQQAQLEPSLAEVEIGDVVQFERKGYFCPDPDNLPNALVFNRTITLRDTWAKLQKR